MRVYTKGYQGAIFKRAKVYSNDPQKGVETISIRAFVKVPIHLSTRYVYLRGLAGATVTRTIKIKAGQNRPLKIEPIHFDLIKKVSYKIEEVEAGRLFLIHFSSMPGPPETYHGFLKLKTNYPDKPEITIRIRGRFKG